MLVEDEDLVRTLARAVLEQQGYTVLEAADAERALTAAEAHGRPIDLLLTDVVLPGMNGRDLAEELRKRQQGVRVLYMSGYTAGLLDEMGLGTGPDLLPKPFSVTQLADRVRAALGRTATS
jgi:DNA-binding response OmpR family regulator